MSDPRLTPANDRVVHDRLRHLFPDRAAVSGSWARVVVPVADLSVTPGGLRARQLLAGARFLTLDRQGDQVFGQAGYDGYVGWLPAGVLGPDHGVTHRVSALASHIYPGADMKTGPLGWLPHGALVEGAPVEGVPVEGAPVEGAPVEGVPVEGAPVEGAGDDARTDTGSAGDISPRGGGHTGAGRFVALRGGGYVPAQHLAPLTDPAADPVAEAMRYLGVPYLWGGNSPMGIDCSGLVQVACRSCGLDCPGDSDLQRATVGLALDPAGTPQRGDLVFWDGHVGLCAGPDQLLHANAHHMAVTLEGLRGAASRMAAAGVGPVRALRRPG